MGEEDRPARLNDEDAAWLRERLDKVFNLLESSYQLAKERAEGRGEAVSFNAWEAIGYGAALAYIQVGKHFGVIDPEVAAATLNQYLGLGPSDLSDLGDDT